MVPTFLIIVLIKIPTQIPPLAPNPQLSAVPNETPSINPIVHGSYLFLCALHRRIEKRLYVIRNSKFSISVHNSNFLRMNGSGDVCW